MLPHDLTGEEWREYDFGTPPRIYRIMAPLTLWIGTTTHRVLDHQGFVHCVPSPGWCGCVLRWKPKDPTQPVQF